MSKTLAHNKTRLVVLAAICLIVGFMLVAYYWRHMGRWNWVPLEKPLQMVAGETVAGDFEAGLDGVYEVELKVDWVLSDEDLDRLIYLAEGKAPIDVLWSVTTLNGQSVAKGDCRDYLYLSQGGHSFREKLKGLLFNIPFYRDSSEGTISRGVGRFTARAGQQYQIRGQVGTSLKELSPARPRLVVRLSRELWERQHESTKRKAKAGYLFLGAAGLLAFISIVNKSLAGKTA